MNLGNLGLELVTYIHDPITDTHAILARGAFIGPINRSFLHPPILSIKLFTHTGRRALVLAFRGTLSSRNMLTDLKLGQVPLPDMRIGRGRRRRGEEGRFLLGTGGGMRGGIFSPGTPPPTTESGGRYGSAGALDRLTALNPAMRTASAGELSRLGGSVDENADRYRRRASTPPQQPCKRDGGSSARQKGAAGDVAPFVPASPVALPWAGPADQRRASSGAAPAALTREHNPASQQRLRSTSADYGKGRPWSLDDEGDGTDDEAWGEGEEETLLQGLSDSTAALSPSILGCRQSLSRLPALRHTLPHVHAGFWGAYTGVRAQLLVAIKRALDTE